MKLKYFIDKCLKEDIDNENNVSDILASSEDSKFTIFLIGPPAIGKTTWIKNNLSSYNPAILSRDSVVDSVSSSFGFTYDDMFVYPPLDSKIGDVHKKYGKVIEKPSYMFWWNGNAYSKIIEANNKVEDTFQKETKNAFDNSKFIVIDLTNMSKGSRKSMLQKAKESDHEAIAVIFNFKGNEKLIKDVAEKRRLILLKSGTHKTIGPEVYDRMFSSYEEPTKEEGFDFIVNYSSIDHLKSFLENKDLEG